MNPYLEKYSFCKKQINRSPKSDLGIIVVIPSYKEPHLIDSLQSLYDCQKTVCSIEVIVVVNSSENESLEVLKQNEQTIKEAEKWINAHQQETKKYYILNATNLPQKHAGVGLARKIGMDEAVGRFEQINKPEGVIVCFDADCTCDSNYLRAIEEHFNKNPKNIAASIYFEHPLEGSLYNERTYHGIVNYELFLRYYNQSLRYSGFPYAYHTIGSSMAVRSNVYQKQGGMNKRKAGEDFYFLHKVIPLGNFSEINETKVVPSPRASDRVPFGTGKAIAKWLENDEDIMLTYHPQTFVDLKELFSKLILFYEKHSDKVVSTLPKPIIDFLEKNNFDEKLEEIKQNVSSLQMFLKRFFYWFDGFMVLKYVHFARDNYYQQTNISAATLELIRLLQLPTVEGKKDTKQLLILYRNLDKLPYNFDF